MPLRISLPDVEATEALGAALAHDVQRGDVVFLKGDLGSGKTSLSRGFLRRFFGNPALDVPSPSYLLHFAYTGSEPAAKSNSAASGSTAASSEPANGGDGAVVAKTAGCAFQVNSGTSLVPGCPVHHVDPYRLPAGKIAALIDFESIFSSIALVEWPERLGSQLVSDESPPRLEVIFEGFGAQGEGREVLLSGVGPRWKEIVLRWQAEGGPLRSRPSDPVPLDAGAEASAVPAAPDLLLTPQPISTRNCKALPADPSQWRVLGIESSCDDTGAAVLTGTGSIIGEALASQAGIHEKWGGVVPKLAQEGHKQAIDATVDEAMSRAGVTAADLSAVAVTVGPGLGLCLEVGVRKALQVASEHRLPLVRIHHMEAHTMVTRLPSQVNGELKAPELEFPFMTLLVSGGHNMAVLSRGIGRHTILGSTIDDSIGEAFDKTARLLGITQIPGGPHLESLAKEGDANMHSLPMPLKNTRDPLLRTGCDYSFSGLKTAARSLIEKQLPANKTADMPEAELRQSRAHVAAAFQSTAVAHLCERASRAVEWALEMEPSVRTIVVAGGVAANKSVREGLTFVAENASTPLKMMCPPPRLCVDNGVMVAWTGVERLRLGLYEEPPTAAGAEHAVEIRPRWPLGVRDSRSINPKQPAAPKDKKRKQAQQEKGGDTDSSKRPATAEHK